MIAAEEPHSPFEFARLVLGCEAQLLLRDRKFLECAVIDQRDAAFGDRADRVLRLERGAELAHDQDVERRERLFRRIEELLDTLGMPRSLEAAGVARADFEEALPELARAAFEDASIRTNPRIPLVHELTQLLEAGFHSR